MTTLYLDIETRSACDLRKTGVYVYAQDPTTDVIVARFAIDAGEILEWRRGEIIPGPVIAAVENGWRIVAHNVGFERTLWREVLTPRYGWPEPALEQWDCTMARARAAGLPGSLDGAAKALGSPIAKDLGGQRLMLQMCKPRRVEADGAIVWWDDDDRMQRLSDYCADDVRVERWLDRKLPKLSPAEQEVWLADQRLNDTGVPIDIPFCRAAAAVATAARKDLDKRMKQVTGGAVGAATNVRGLVQWLMSRGVEIEEPGEEDEEEDEADDELPELRRRDVERLLAGPIGGPEREALQIRLEAGKTSTKKIDAMLARANADDRVRGMLSYHGAATGRWSAAGSGIQLQNLPRAGVRNWDTARQALDGGVDLVELVYGPPLDLISRMLRGAICARPGRRLVHADLASVEARGVAWLAGQDDLVERFATGADVYCDMAGEIFGRTITKKDEDERWLGKGVILGCGYGMGWRRFRDTCAAQGRVIPDDLAERAVRSYRTSYDRIPALWRAIEHRAKEAVRRPKDVIELDSTGRIKFRVRNDWLQMRLPSGRRIFYREPTIEIGENGDEQLTYMGVNSFSKKWERQRTHGPRLTENAVQGLCRDVIAEALLRVGTRGYTPILTVHDEIICETDEGFGSADEMISILTELPAWADGFPINAEGKAGRRYSK
jgi:DNA polymerase bacteriophage-type